jgi:hypothetical protein
LHEACKPLEFLLGTWRGRGKGVYPTIDDFEYEEEVRFTHLGKPFLAYSQSTWSAADGRPMHGESGFWRPQANGRIEIVLAHPFGATEILEGTISGTRIDVKSTSLATTATAKDIAETGRTFDLRNDALVYEMGMATSGQRLQGHLIAELHRV